MKKLILLLIFIPIVGFGQINNFKSEISVKNYFDSKDDLDELEGIFNSYYYQTLDFKRGFAVIKRGSTYLMLLHVFDDRSNPGNDYGDLMFEFKRTNIDSILDWTWADRSKSKVLYIDGEIIIPEGTLIKEDNKTFFSKNKHQIKFVKYYPKKRKKDKSKVGQWTGNGSGIIISKSGHIVTNNHVIEDADYIEVEFILNDQVQKFNAEVVQKDLRNDLAIIKIVDRNFDGLNNINYNFKTRSSDVGTRIYTFGYPKALSGMGKEIKVTEGIISSKSGIMGDITTYQITAPVQGGNSGGPLFDDKGNLVGINSSRFKSNETENVNYSIKSSYILNLIDVMPKNIDLPSNTKLQ